MSKETESDEVHMLRPCPFCGGIVDNTDVHDGTDPKSGGCALVTCSTCHAQGPIIGADPRLGEEFDYAAAAIDLWETRK
jgi:hypothetical protein